MKTTIRRRINRHRKTLLLTVERDHYVLSAFIDDSGFKVDEAASVPMRLAKVFQRELAAMLDKAETIVGGDS